MFINNFFDRFARLMIEEYEEDPTFTLSAGVQRVIWSGCMIPKVNCLHIPLWRSLLKSTFQIYTKAPCPIDITGIANNITTYRHVGYDAFNELFYLCDVASGKVGSFAPLFQPESKLFVKSLQDVHVLGGAHM